MHKEEIFGKILQEERKAKKISQEKLAKLTGLDRTFISLIENGKRSPTFSTILKICFRKMLQFIGNTNGSKIILFPSLFLIGFPRNTLFRSP